jgi:lysozyme family protein
MSVYDNAFRAVIGEEGGFTANPADPGNWTGGGCGRGQCSGTKFGISAAAYPSLDISALSLDDARAIYKRDYWDRIHADDLPPALAALVFDAAVNSGPDRAVRWLQSALHVKADGVLGPVTLAAARNCAGQGAAIIAEYQAQRLVFLAGLPTWRTFGLGWARRVCRMQFEALKVGEAA